VKHRLSIEKEKRKRETRPVQIYLPLIDYRKLMLLKSQSLIRSYSQFVYLSFENALKEKWKEFEEMYPELAKTIHDDSQWDD
jgi:hypothetical protein